MRLFVLRTFALCESEGPQFFSRKNPFASDSPTTPPGLLMLNHSARPRIGWSGPGVLVSVIVDQIAQRKKREKRRSFFYFFLFLFVYLSPPASCLVCWPVCVLAPYSVRLAMAWPNPRSVFCHVCLCLVVCDYRESLSLG